MENITITESDKNKITKHLSVDPLPVNKFAKNNNLEEVTDPVFFIKPGVPTSKGLLSNEIFGITKDDRSNIFAYIDLGGTFMHPLIYKKWSTMDSRIKNIVYGTKCYRIENGDFIEDENGKTGIDFLAKNIDNINIKKTSSKKRDVIISYIEKYKNIMFMNKLTVIPAYFRDVDTRDNSMGVGVLNKHYANVLVLVKSLKETKEYGLDMGDGIKGRIQQSLVNVYNCLSGTSGAETDGNGLSQKHGLVRNSVLSKTSDYSTRLVLSAPQLKVENPEDLMVDLDHCGLPLASAIVNFRPFILFQVKRFFENELGGTTHSVIDPKTNEIKYETIQEPLLQFSDDRIEEEINRFIYGYSNRFIPVTLKLDNNKTGYMIFKGKDTSAEDIVDDNTIDKVGIHTRKLTWCDIFFMAAVEVTRNRCVLITRFPMDSCYNQFPTKVRISSTIDTEPMVINGVLYKWYPKIRDVDINSNTSNLFNDALNISNLFLFAIGGDYDGDQASVKGVYFDESNAELIAYIDSIKNYIDLSGFNMRVSSNEAVQARYNLTKVLPEDKKRLTQPKF